MQTDSCRTVQRLHGLGPRARDRRRGGASSIYSTATYAEVSGPTESLAAGTTAEINADTISDRRCKLVFWR